jgi:endogenous inhibitor of DNA gyrase (YacG/DUF329 family)
MPELSEQQRRKMVELDARFAAARLVDALELKWDITFRCAACGTSKTWRRDTMLGRARPLLGSTMAEIQRRTPCPRCGRRMPQMNFSGMEGPGPLADQLRAELINTLIDAGLKPTDYGIGWTPSAARR